MLKQVVKCISRERKFVNQQLACQWISAVTGWMTYRISVRFLLPISQAVTSNLQTPRKQPCTSPNFRTCAQSTVRTLVARQFYNSCTRQGKPKFDCAVLCRMGRCGSGFVLWVIVSLSATAVKSDENGMYLSYICKHIAVK